MPKKDVWQDGKDLSSQTCYSLGLFQVEFENDGSISKLIDGHGKAWADVHRRIGSYQYETFGMDHYNNWFQSYVENWSQTHSWADADFGKPGMEFAQPKPEHKQFSPKLNRILTRSEEAYDLVQIQLSMTEECVQIHGAPREIRIDYKFYKDEKKIDVDLSWFDKPAYRLPEASWFSFALKVDNPNLWRMEKLGEKISPLEVVKNGNRNLHAVHMWYEENTKFRFSIRMS
ncbi:DUF5054 domain-containing protein [Paenibacillus sp. LMG 31460]|uniref:DUF5054 domain-containing protein n=2 Tax=Paenibacillus germinis TaxID=2654979 RepID=A0ABX1Z8X1_9BACL|nr:DUF5054 domain-containing protein [Paenibacillus germinis]